MKKITTLFVILVIVLSGCTAPVIETKNSEAETEEIVVPTDTLDLTPTLTPEPTLTFTPTITATPLPTETPTLTPINEPVSLSDFYHRIPEDWEWEWRTIPGLPEEQFEIDGLPTFPVESLEKYPSDYFLFYFVISDGNTGGWLEINPFLYKGNIAKDELETIERDAFAVTDDLFSKYPELKAYIAKYAEKNSSDSDIEYSYHLRYFRCLSELEYIYLKDWNLSLP